MGNLILVDWNLNSKNEVPHDLRQEIVGLLFQLSPFIYRIWVHSTESFIFYKPIGTLAGLMIYGNIGEFFH